MRYSVLISDILTYISASLLLAKLIKSQALAIVLLLYPGLILIDHGHFQYNSVSIGLSLFSYISFINNHDIIGTILFCLALNFKQMLLYYSLPIFSYLLGKCFKLNLYNLIKKFLKLSLTVLITFFLLWLPFINVIKFVFIRLFPIERGLFEDKVSNFWCLINVFIKIRNYFNNDQLAILCALITFITVLPTCYDLFKNPNEKKFILSLINSSLSFFLYSYQVHEKTILIVSMPIILYYNYEPIISLWFLLITSLSMLPLLIKDGLIIPTISLNLIFLITCCFLITNIQIKFKFNLFSKSFLLLLSFILSLIIIILCLYGPIPKKYPDLYSLIVSVYSAIHFICFFIYFNYVQLIKFKLN
ncbi:hypothetical protein O3M35_004493 [Rhynocoris fuscipes]|uniref:Alpha-1,3-glucosyltransferase n=1 Tax=Rhynocoris fuscipes TaxID=488301 RepID=A0AAW1CFY8_9HEMI